MKKYKLRDLVALLFVILSILSYTYPSVFSDYSRQTINSISIPNTIFEYNSTYCTQQTSFTLQKELYAFNNLILLFTTSGDKSNNNGIRITFTFGNTEVLFIIERFYQDHLGHNLTQFFSYPENFSEEQEVILTVEAQTSLWYETGSIQIYSYSTIEQIEPASITKDGCSLLLVPNLLRFMGSSTSTERRTTTTVFNNSANFDNVNFTLSFLANDFTAYKQYIEVYINDHPRSTRVFVENQLTIESFLLTIDSGINYLKIVFVVEICIGEVEFSSIQLSGRGINYEDFLPENMYCYYGWNKNEFTHNFDLSPLKPNASYGEQILELGIDYGYHCSLATTINYEIWLSEKIVDSGEIITQNQPSLPLIISVKTLSTDSDELLVFRIYGNPEEEGVFYLLNSSYVNIFPLPELQEQGKVERVLAETENHSTSITEPLILTFQDYCKISPDHIQCNISLSFSLVNEFGSAVRQIDILMQVDLLTVFNNQLSYSEYVTLCDNKTLYSNLSRISVTLVIYGDGADITLSNLFYSLDSLSDDSEHTNPFNPSEEYTSNLSSPLKSTILYLEYGFLLLFFGLFFSRRIAKKRETGELIHERERESKWWRKIIRFPKNWWLKTKESFFKLSLLPLSLCYLVYKVLILNRTVDEYTFLDRFSNYFLYNNIGKWGFFLFIGCVYVSSFVALSTLFLITTPTFYRDLFKVTQFLGIILSVFYLPSCGMLLVYLVGNGFGTALINIVPLPVLFLLILVFLKYLKKSEQNQPDKLIDFFFRTNKSETEEQTSNHTRREIVKEDLSQKEYDEYKLKLLNYIISKITPEIQVSVNRFAERFFISPELAHTLLTEINNNFPDLGKYFIEEGIYKRSSDCEIGTIILGKNNQEKCGELNISSVNNSVNVNTEKNSTELERSNQEISQTESIRETDQQSTKQLDLVKMYIGELKGLKLIGKIIHSDPRTFKKEITSLGIEVPFPSSYWFKVRHHFQWKFFYPIPDQLEEIILGCVLGDAQLRLQSRENEHRNNPTVEEYSLVLDKIDKIREKAKNKQLLNETEIQYWNYAIKLIKRTNTANLRFHKSIFEIEWVKFLTDIFNEHINLTTYVKPLNSPSSKWTCGFDTSSSIQMFQLWKKWYKRINNKNTKILPLISEITPNILLHWYAGDGYMSGSDISLCSQSFTLQENQKLVRLLRERDIECKIRLHKKKPFIGISSKKDNREIFFGFMEQAKYFKEAEKLLLPKFTNSITKKEWKMDLLERYPEIQRKDDEAKKTLETILNQK